MMPAVQRVAHQPRRRSKIGKALKMSIAHEKAAISLDAKRRRLDARVGRHAFNTNAGEAIGRWSGRAGR